MNNDLSDYRLMVLVCTTGEAWMKAAEIRKRARRSTRRWAVSVSHFYPQLEWLVAAGYVEQRLPDPLNVARVMGRRPKMYRISEQGKAALQYYGKEAS